MKTFATTAALLLGAFHLFCPIAQALAADSPQAITADIISADGKKIGEVKAMPAQEGVSLHVHVSGLTPGEHGIHIHSNGVCQGPDFKSAGGHYAKAGQHHGLENPQGPHWGDLPNLKVGKDGKGHGIFTAKGVTLSAGDGSLNKAGGTSLIIHAGQDDEKSDPSGNSGDRVACAVLAK